MCLSRGSWAQNDQNQEGNSAEDLVAEVEPENQTLCEPVTPSGGLNRGMETIYLRVLINNSTFLMTFLMAQYKDQHTDA